MIRHFSVDARAMLTWGRESIKDHTTAVLELVKNSYDANATIVQVQIHTGLLAEGGPFVRIADDGIGMSAKDVDDSWLRLGYSAKREDRFTPRGRRKTGEKGIGRISADRLGATLELRSQTTQDPPIGLRVCWNDFEEPGRDIARVSVPDLSDPSFKIPTPSSWESDRKDFSDPPADVPNSSGRSGTELMIRDLRQLWAPEDVQELRRLLSLLTPPFERVDDFQIRLDTDVDETVNGVVVSPLLASAAIEGTFDLDDHGKVKGKLVHRTGTSSKRVQTAFSTPFEQFIHPKVRPGEQAAPKDQLASLGPVSVRLLFYPQTAETVRGLDLGLSDLRAFLAANAGVRVYRDRIRVPPYGDAGKTEGDWLGLGDRKARNPAGPNRPEFRVSPYQLVGAVFVGRDANPGLVDTSGREGLVAGEALSLLRSFLIGCLTRLEAKYHELFAASSSKHEQDVASSPRDTVQDLRTHLTELAETIKKTEGEFPPSVNRNINQVVEQLATTTEKLRRVEKTVDELGSQAATSRTLATIGIASATFGHETQRGLDTLRASLEAAKLLLENGEDREEVLSELEKAIHESDRVSAWGAFALGRVRRDKRVRRLVAVEGLIQTVLDEIDPAMIASSIKLDGRDLKPVKARVFAMDVECVVINLLTNAYYFAKQHSRDRRVTVRLHPKSVDRRRGFEIVVSDSGPGVAKGIIENIWNPLFTTKTDETGKPVGTGLGLALVNAVVQDTEGRRTVDRDPKLDGARFSIWLPDIGG